jgi:3-oxoacyl-[acyl-carrier protein] reductase
MELGLSGKVALVTGSSRGIGRGVALALADEGCNVVLTGRDAGALDEVAASARAKGVKAAVAVLDLREPCAPATLIETARREFGRLDILVNNAGATRRGDFFALSDADWQDGFALKFFTIGSSVNAACAAFSKALADLGKQDGVQVNCIHPSLVDTDRQGRRVQAEMQRTGEPEAAIRAQFCRDAGITRFGTTQDVAGLVCFIVSKNGSWLHGATIDLDGGEIQVL